MRNLLCSVSRFSEDESQKLNDIFLRHEKEIEKAVNYHIYKYGGDYESLYARAVDKLILAFCKHDPSRSSWEKYLSVQIRLGLKDEMLEHYRKSNRTSNNLEEELSQMAVLSLSEFDLESIKSCLMPDSLYVLNYILENSEECTKRGHIRNIYNLTKRMGWSTRRIKTVFSEIRCFLELNK
jgi:hypothetical protein